MPDPVPAPFGAAGLTVSSATADKPPETSLRERLELALGKLVVMRITTVVGTVSALEAGELHQVTTLKLDPANQQVASTSFNMLLGDGSVIVSPIFVTDPAYKALHDQTIKDAREIRAQSVQLLKDMWDKFEPLLTGRLDNKPGP